MSSAFLSFHVVENRKATYKAKSSYTNRGYKDASGDEEQIRLWWHSFLNALTRFLLSASQYGLAEHNAPECLPYDGSSVFDVDGLLNLFP